MDHETLRFDPFELDMRLRELRTGSKRVRLQEQPFEILRMMLARPGDVVTRDELRQRLWPEGTFVDFEHSLNAAVKRLRAALGDDADHPRFVETLPRRGYRFIGKIDPGGVAGGGPAPATPRGPRLAVLPFQNLTTDPAQEYFSDGLTEEMIAQLGRLCRGRVAVVSRWSSMVFKGSTRRAREIGETLRADYLLEGSVRGDGDRVRVVARLVEAAAETHLWSETYERELVDDLSVQTDIATRIARSLATELAPEHVSTRRAPVDAAAYQEYLKGRYYWNKPFDEGLDQAVMFFERALRMSPSFAGGHAALARAWVARAEYYHQLPRAALMQADAAAARALELDPDHYEAHMAVADVRRMLDADWASSEAGYRRAIALNPSYESAYRGYALLLSAMGRHGDALRESQRACDLDPLCLTVSTSSAWVHFAAGDFDGAIERCRHTIDMDPEFVPARLLLGAAQVQADRGPAGLAELESAALIADANPVVLCWLVQARAASGGRREAEALIDRVVGLARERYVPAYHLAIAYTAVGRVDAAFDALDRACADRDPARLMLAVDPRFDGLRDDPRFEARLGRAGLGRDRSGARIPQRRVDRL